MCARPCSWSSFVTTALLVIGATVSRAQPLSSPPPPSPPAAVPASSTSTTAAPTAAPGSAAVVVKPPPLVESRELRIVVAGRPPVVVTPTTLAAHTPLSSTQAGGKTKQYPLRALLEKVVGPGARLVAVADHYGNRSAVDAALLAAPDVLPVVWTNRRGLFKVGFVDARGRRLDDSVEFRDVVELQVVVGP